MLFSSQPSGITESITAGRPRRATAWAIIARQNSIGTVNSILPCQSVAIQLKAVIAVGITTSRATIMKKPSAPTATGAENMCWPQANTLSTPIVQIEVDHRAAAEDRLAGEHGDDLADDADAGSAAM